MHKSSCGCTKCQAARDRVFPVEAFETGWLTGELLSEAEEMELAMELLGVSNEDEMEQFLGKLFRGIGRGLKKVGRFVGRKVLPKIGGALKGLAKKALPFVGGALGSLIPIPGVGTALGSALGSAVSKALEMEFGELESDEAELEVARRLVRIAATTARQASTPTPDAPAAVGLQDALLAALRTHLPSFAANEAELMAEAEAEMGYAAEGAYERAYEGAYEGEYEGAYEGEGAYAGTFELSPAERPCSPAAGCERPLGGAAEKGFFTAPTRPGGFRWYTPARGDNLWSLSNQILTRHFAALGRMAAPSANDIASLSNAIRDHRCNAHLRDRMFLPRFKKDRFACGGAYYPAIFIPIRNLFTRPA